MPPNIWPDRPAGFRNVLEPLFAVLRPDGRAMLMIKPQFEVGRERLGAGGVVHSPSDRRQAIDAVVEDAAGLGWIPQWRADSQLAGPAGNLEHFVCFHAVRSEDEEPDDIRLG